MGPMSAPAGRRIVPDKAQGHSKCQDRERCTGPGCRVRTGKTYHKRAGVPSVRQQAEYDALREAVRENQETAA